MKNKKQFPDLNSKPNFSEIELTNFFDASSLDTILAYVLAETFQSTLYS